MRKAFCFISCVNDERLYARCEACLDALRVPPGYAVEKRKITGAKSMAEGYNRGQRSSGARYKVYLHQDTFILDQDLLFHLRDLFRDPRIGLAGVVGSTRLPASGYWAHDPRHSHGDVLENRRQGGIWGWLLGPLNRRRPRASRYRPVPRPWMPVLVVDGLLMATQYDLPWREDLDLGFLYYEGPQCLEYIKAGYLVVVPHQERPWCLHYGSREERSPAEQAERNQRLDEKLALFRREYPEFLGKDVQDLRRSGQLPL